MNGRHSDAGIAFDDLRIDTANISDDYTHATLRLVEFSRQPCGSGPS
jgi:hypothetical protein